MYDINKDIIESIEAARERGSRPSGWALKCNNFLKFQCQPGATRWFDRFEVLSIMRDNYGAEISDEVIGLILMDGVDRNIIGESGGRYRVL